MQKCRHLNVCCADKSDEQRKQHICHLNISVCWPYTTIERLVSTCECEIYLLFLFFLPHPTSQSRSRILNNTNMYYCSIAFATNHQKKFILQILNHNVSTKHSSQHKNQIIKMTQEYLNRDTQHNLSKIECLDALDVGKLVFAI